MRKDKRTMILVACLVLCPHVLISAQALPELVGRLPYGPAHDAVVADPYLYYGSGAALIIADTSDPAVRTVVGEVTLPDLVTGIALSGSYAYVADDYSGLRIVDISDPSAPVEVGGLETTDPAKAVAVTGTTACILETWQTSGIRLFDVTNPSQPQEVGYFLAAEASDLIASGDYLYVADRHLGLRVIDVSNPAAPEEVGRFCDYCGPDGVKLDMSGTMVYVIDNDGGMWTIDVSTPSWPTFVSYYYSFNGLEMRDISVADGYAFVPAQDDFTVPWGLLVIDLEHPTAPIEIAFCELNDPRYSHGFFKAEVTVSESHAYIATGSPGLRVVDISSPAAPIDMVSYETMGEVHEVGTGDGYSFLTEQGFVNIVDISPESEPRLVSQISTQDSDFVPHPVSSGSQLYLLLNNGPSYGLHIYDISDPALPAEVDSLSAVGSKGIALYGSSLVIVGNPGLQMVDPSVPTVVGSWSERGRQTGLAVSGDRAYCYGSDYVSVIEISTPTAPTELGYWELPADTSVEDIAVTGTMIAVTLSDGLYLVDASTPSLPVQVGFRPEEDPGWGNRVAARGSFVYLTQANNDLRVLDISNPAAIAEVGVIELPGYGVFDIEMDDYLLHVSTKTSGLMLFDASESFAIFEDGFEGGSTSRWSVIVN